MGLSGFIVFLSAVGVSVLAEPVKPSVFGTVAAPVAETVQNVAAEIVAPRIFAKDEDRINEFLNAVLEPPTSYSSSSSSDSKSISLSSLPSFTSSSSSASFTSLPSLTSTSTSFTSIPSLSSLESSSSSSSSEYTYDVDKDKYKGIYPQWIDQFNNLDPEDLLAFEQLKKEAFVMALATLATKAKVEMAKLGAAALAKFGLAAAIPAAKKAKKVAKKAGKKAKVVGKKAKVVAKKAKVKAVPKVAKAAVKAKATGKVVKAKAKVGAVKHAKVAKKVVPPVAIGVAKTAAIAAKKTKKVGGAAKAKMGAGAAGMGKAKIANELYDAYQHEIGYIDINDVDAGLYKNVDIEAAKIIAVDNSIEIP